MSLVVVWYFCVLKWCKWQYLFWFWIELLFFPFFQIFILDIDCKLNFSGNLINFENYFAYWKMLLFKQTMLCAGQPFNRFHWSAILRDTLPIWMPNLHLLDRGGTVCQTTQYPRAVQTWRWARHLYRDNLQWQPMNRKSTRKSSSVTHS